MQYLVLRAGRRRVLNYRTVILHARYKSVNGAKPQPSGSANFGTPLPADLHPDVPGTPAYYLQQDLEMSEGGITGQLLRVIGVYKRALQVFALSGTIVCVGYVLAFMGSHAWTEHYELAPEEDPTGELQRWGWNLEVERWSGGDQGGTDQGLGIRARHSVRAAWMAQRWGSFLPSEIDSVARSRQEDGKATSEHLEEADGLLKTALAVMYKKMSDATTKGKTANFRQGTAAALLSRNAEILELIGTRVALLEARDKYKQVWDELDKKDLESARIAMKLGHVFSRLGDNDEAISWLSKSLQLVSPNPSNDQGESQRERPLQTLTMLPKMPLAQRLFSSILTSLSAVYAQSGRLQDASAVQEIGLALLKTKADKDVDQANSPDAGIAISPSHTLHELFLLHRASILSMHNTEVSYVLHTANLDSSTKSLVQVAALSEQIASILVGSIPQRVMQSDGCSSKPVSFISNTPLDKSYSSSKTLKKPASNLLRDTRRTVVEACIMQGVLYDSQLGKDESAMQALECYEKAIRWAGIDGNAAGEMSQHGDLLLEDESQSLWRSYVYAREKVERLRRQDIRNKSSNTPDTQSTLSSFKIEFKPTT